MCLTSITLVILKTVRCITAMRVTIKFSEMFLQDLKHRITKFIFLLDIFVPIFVHSSCNPNKEFQSGEQAGCFKSWTPLP